VAALKKDNFYGTQFHPEKSSEVGEKILKILIDIVSPVNYEYTP